MNFQQSCYHHTSNVHKSLALQDDYLHNARPAEPPIGAAGEWHLSEKMGTLSVNDGSEGSSNALIR